MSNCDSNPGPAAYVPKVGDFVRIKSSRYAYGAGDYIGHLGHVIHIDAAPASFSGVDPVCVEVGGAKCYYRPSDLEPEPSAVSAAGLPAEAVERPEWVRVLRYCAQGTNTVRRVLEWNEMGRPIVESACEGNDGRWELVSDDQWEPADAPPPTPDARVVALEAEVVMLLKSRSKAEDIIIAERKAHAAELARVRGECRAASLRAEAAERARDEAVKRAEAAEAGWKSCREAYTRESLRGGEWWRRMTAAEEALKPTTAPATTLTAEDRAWMDARQECDLTWAPERKIGVTAKAAIAARAKGGVA